jgi:hypothetical protein
MVVLTEETIQATRQWFADNHQGCIGEVKNGQVTLPSHVNPEEYFAERRRKAAESLAGKWDHTLTFRQRATYIQTGECHAILP